MKLPVVPRRLRLRALWQPVRKKSWKAETRERIERGVRETAACRGQGAGGDRQRERSVSRTSRDGGGRGAPVYRFRSYTTQRPSHARLGHGGRLNTQTGRRRRMALSRR